MQYVEKIKEILPDFSVYVYAIITLIVPLIITKIVNMVNNYKSQQTASQSEESPAFLSEDLSSNIAVFQEKIGGNRDVIIRELFIEKEGISAAIIFTKGIVDTETINNNILEPLMYTFCYRNNDEPLQDQLLNILPISEVSEENDINAISSEILTGKTALLLQNTGKAFILNTCNRKSRSLEEPVSELLVRGPRISFNENLIENIALLRCAGVNMDLKIISYEVGERFKKELIITYVDSIANPDIVANVTKKMESINMDNLPESGYIEQLIEDNSYSLFPQLQSTERPDRVIAALSEGRVGILLDGTPFALIVPVTINMFMQSPEDYYERWIPGSLIRLLRYTAAFIAVFTPALYISFVSFHQGLIPTKLAISIIGSREGVPFPILIEALLMEVSIEILREAGLRLPTPIGQTIGIVGGLVIGEAAVQAGIVSPVTVIVVALTAISSFSLPQYNFSISLRILRFIAMFLAAALGLYGVIVFLLFFCIHLVRLKSFGVPYLSPAVPYQPSDWKDFLIRFTIPAMKKRPKTLKPDNVIRKG